MSPVDTIKLVAEWFKAEDLSFYVVGNQSREYVARSKFAPGDFDIASNASPVQVQSILRKRRILPLTVNDFFGVVSFKFEGYSFEVATFRRDHYSKEDLQFTKRYPSRIEFIKSPKADSARRDFTINALYLNPLTDRVLDYVGGSEDLSKKVIRSIGSPTLRFQEDPLRMLRAVRLKHQLGFKYHGATTKALRANIHLLRKLNPGVLKKELQKLHDLENFQAAYLELREMGFLPHQ